MNSSFSTNQPGAIHPILPFVLVQNWLRGKELNKFCPPNSSDDPCFLSSVFYPSSMHFIYLFIYLYFIFNNLAGVANDEEGCCCFCCCFAFGRRQTLVQTHVLRTGPAVLTFGLEIRKELGQKPHRGSANQTKGKSYVWSGNQKKLGKISHVA